MPAAATVVLLVAAMGASLFTAWTIGAGSSGSTPFAPAVGANAISTMRAALIVGILGFLGAVLQGANVSETIGGEFVRGVELSPLAATIVLLVSAGLIAAGIFRGYPIATAFAVSGSVVGAGLSMGGRPAWGVIAETVLFWLATPIAGVVPAFMTAWALRTEHVPTRVLVALLGAIVGAIVANISFTGLGAGGQPAAIAAVVANRSPGPGPVIRLGVTGGLGALVAAVLWVASRRGLQRTQQQFLLALGSLVAFSAGGGKVGLAIGPLLPLVAAFPAEVPLIAVLAFGGVGLLAGSWTASTRMIKALSQDYSDLGPRRSIAVLVPSFAIAQAGIFLGVPMSFNEIFVSAIVGSGIAAGSNGISRRKIGYTALAWIGSLVGAFVLSYAAYAAVDGVGLILTGEGIAYVPGWARSP